MRSEKNHEMEAARTTNTNERIKRRRNSSRCSRKDIWPPSSSSLPLFEDNALMNADIVSALEPFVFAERFGCGFSGGRGDWLRGGKWFDGLRGWSDCAAASDDEFRICCRGDEWFRRWR